MKKANWIKEVSRVSYHRNGVGGAGFFAIEFKMLDDSNTLRRFVATVDPSELMQTRVLCLDDISEKWRGDRIVGELQAFMKVTKAQPFEKKLSDLSVQGGSVS